MSKRQDRDAKMKTEQSAQQMAWERLNARKEQLADAAIMRAPKYEEMKLKAAGCTTAELASALSQCFTNVTFSASFEEGRGFVTAVPRRDTYNLKHTSHTEESLNKVEAALELVGDEALAAVAPSLIYPAPSVLEAFATAYGMAYTAGKEEGRKEASTRRDKDCDFPGFHPAMFHPFYGRRGSW
ncbi:MAG: hypothetical protein BWY99_00330 [Synergistetes bacterium ADurb.BinA166]|nr:MAG: hypothetical protein BWY99_00330 [Synergistetes bacterium ADurb.BinA166]